MAQIKDLKRMCEFYKGCSKCELFATYDICRVCFLPDNADEIVDEWVKEHPVKTYAMDFFEKFPNAPKGKYGTPTTCITTIYGDEFECLEGGCIKCWNQEMKGELQWQLKKHSNSLKI